MRDTLARSFDLSVMEPSIQVVDVNLLGDRRLQLRHVRLDGVPLDQDSRDATLAHIQRFWGYEVALEEVDLR